MGDAFVNLSYRGLVLGKRIKLTQVRQATGYLEMPTPMPVGTAIAIATDEGVTLEALVAEIHEQVGGSDRPPGMVVKPKLDADAQRTWWSERAVVDPAPAEPVEEGGGHTQVMPVVAEEIDVGEENLRDTNPSNPIIDDGKRTIAMDIVDLEALGLDPAASSGSMPAVTDEPSGGNKKKPKKKKR